MFKSILNSSIYQPTSNIDHYDCKLSDNKASKQIDDALGCIVDDDEVIQFNNATVCMIDICGFSTWCSNQLPTTIVQAMKQYNLFLTKKINEYESLSKIELVGDCCMVVGGLFDNIRKNESTLELIRFAVNVIQNLNEIHDIFMDASIGLRIGIHISNVFGIMISNPRRFQLYGNDINVCSRLESSAVKNSIHISYKTIMSTQGLCNAICGPCAYCMRSTMVNDIYKGVGEQKSFLFFVKRHEILWYHTIAIKLNSLLKNFDDFSNVKLINECPIENMKSFFWDHVIIFVESIESLRMFVSKVDKFRVWERKRMSQNITLVVLQNVYDEYINEKHDLDTSMYNVVKHVNDNNKLTLEIKHLIESKRNINKSKSSMDLKTCT